MHSPWRLIGKLGVMPKGSLYSGRLRGAESLVYMSFDAALFCLFGPLPVELRRGVSWPPACRRRERERERERACARELLSPSHKQVIKRACSGIRQTLKPGSRVQNREDFSPKNSNSHVNGRPEVQTISLPAPVVLEEQHRK